VRVLIPGVAFVVLVGLLILAQRRRRLGIALVAITLGGAAAWFGSWMAFRADYHDADGAFDCWPDCTPLQDSVWIGFSLVPIAVVALLIVGGLLALGGRIRERRGGGPSRDTAKT
jgi:putative copper export protein